jgi:hypothetical protein|tara:strand:+ start:314 stop:610 length:297 start_codon:yes stop_codon:yes gene_type:complete
MAYFPNGTSFMDWSAWNCDKCIHDQLEDSYCRVMKLHDELNYTSNEEDKRLLNALIPMDEEGLFAKQCTMLHESNPFFHEWDGIGTRFRNETDSDHHT